MTNSNIFCLNMIRASIHFVQLANILFAHIKSLPHIFGSFAEGHNCGLAIPGKGPWHIVHNTFIIVAFVKVVPRCRIIVVHEIDIVLRIYIFPLDADVLVPILGHMLMFEAQNVKELVDNGTDAKAAFAKWVNLQIYHLCLIPIAQVNGIAAQTF